MCRLKQVSPEEYKKSGGLFSWGRALFSSDYIQDREYQWLHDRSLVKMFDLARGIQGAMLYLLIVFIFIIFAAEIAKHWDNFRGLISPR